MTRGLFITGTDTGVGKTYVAALIVRALSAAGRRVGVYKPAASGCGFAGGRLVSDDALALWDAAGRPAELDRVCPQCFAAPLAPHLAARAEGRQLDAALLFSGIDYWHGRCDVIVVEGAGGLLSPLGNQLYVADLAQRFGFPLIVVARNVLGTINHTLQTLLAAGVLPQGWSGHAAHRSASGQLPPSISVGADAAGAGAGHRMPGLPVAGVVLNHPVPPPADDASLASNRAELARHCGVPILAEVAWQSPGFDVAVDWCALAGEPASDAP